MTRPTPAGRRRHRVTVQQPTNSRGDAGFGEIVPTWADVATRWAEIASEGSRELFYARQAHADLSHVVTMRHDSALDGYGPHWRLVWGTRILEVASVNLPDGIPNTDLVWRCREAHGEAAAVTGPEPVAWYKLNGNGLDASGHAQTLTMTGATYAAGHDGLALTDGSGTRSGGIAGLSADAVTISAWYKPDGTSAKQGWAVFGNQSFGLELNDSDTAASISASVIYNGGTVSLDTAGTLTLAANTWHHACVTWDGTTVRLYVNGSLRKATQAADPTSGWHTAAFTVDTDGTLIGTNCPLDDVRVYAVALTGAQVAELAAG